MKTSPALSGKISKYMRRLRYAERKNKYGLARNLGEYDSMLPGFVQAVRRRKNPWVFEIGCGSGLALRQLKDSVEKRGYEPTGRQVKTAGIALSDKRSKVSWYRAPNRLAVASLQKLFKRKTMPKFDVVHSVYGIHYEPNLLQAIEFVCNRALRPGGEAFLHIPFYNPKKQMAPEGRLVVAGENEKPFDWEEEIARLRQEGHEIELVGGRQMPLGVRHPQDGPTTVIHYKKSRKKNAPEVHFPYELHDIETYETSTMKNLALKRTYLPK